MRKGVFVSRRELTNRVVVLQSVSIPHKVIKMKAFLIYCVFAD